MVQRIEFTMTKYLVAGVFAFALILKLTQFVRIAASDGLLANPKLLVFVIGFEAFVASYLIIGDRFRSWQLAVFTFSVFTMATSYSIITDRSCHCFATLVSPRWMLFLDVSTLALLVVSRPPREGPKPHQQHIVYCGLITVLCVALAIWQTTTPPNRFRLESLVASAMLEERWPLDSYFSSELQPLESGRWLVLVIRRDCEHCQQLLAEHFRHPTRHREGERTAIFLAGESNWRFQIDRIESNLVNAASIRFEHGEPFVASPAIFVVNNGIVVEAADGLDADPFIDKLFAISREL